MPTETLGKKYPTLVDVMKTSGADGENAADIIELLAETNDIIKDANYLECNEGNKHIRSIRTGYPEATWTDIYEGVQPSAGSTAEITDTAGYLESLGDIPERLVAKHKKPKLFRLSENRAHMEEMNIAMQKAVFYGKTKDSKAPFNGLAVRYGKLSQNEKNIGYNILDAGGTEGKLTSIYLVCWADHAASLLYKQSTDENTVVAGLTHKDEGLHWIKKSDGKELKVYRDHYGWEIGLTLGDWRACGRIANIPVAALDTENAPDLERLMRKLYNRCKKHFAGGQVVFYVPEEIEDALEGQLKDKNNVVFKMKEYLEDDVLFYKKAAIRSVDQISTSETRVV